MDERPRRRWFSFRLRTLLALIALVALSLEWTERMRQLIAERRALYARYSVYGQCLRVVDLVPADRTDIPWFRRKMGDYPLPTMLYNPRDDVDGGRELRRARELFPETRILECHYFGERLMDKLPKGVERFPPDVEVMSY